MIVGVSVVLNIIGLLLTPTKMILGYPLSQFCFEQLCPVLYTIQWSIFSLIYSYNTTMEQMSVIKQLMELYIIQDDEFHYQGCALAEPGGPWRLTFALRRLENLRFFIQIICWAP